MRCSVRRSLGAYLLDALEPAERAAVDRHLDRCAGCRRELERMAALPALLAAVPGGEGRGLSVAPGRGAGRGRPAALLCLAVLALGLGGWTLLGRGERYESLHARDPATGVRMDAEIVRQPWGSGVEMRLTGVGPGEQCRLVVGGGGRREIAASWEASYAGDAAVYAATSIPAAEVAELSVVTDDGRVLLRTPVQ